jgi:hypothetical protein
MTIVISKKRHEFKWLIDWLIDWLVFNVQRAIFQLYSGREFKWTWETIQHITLETQIQENIWFLISYMLYTIGVSVCVKNILTNIWLSKFNAIFTSPYQFLLDWGLGLMVFWCRLVFILIGASILFNRINLCHLLILCLK